MLGLAGLGDGVGLGAAAGFSNGVGVDDGLGVTLPVFQSYMDKFSKYLAFSNIRFIWVDCG